MSKKEPAIICDLDGTLALLNGRDPFDASSCEEDVLNLPIATIIKQYQAKPIFVSGRFEKFREPTARWLSNHGFLLFELFMRKDGDYRKDYIVKKEIYEENIKDRYDVEFVIDDRPQVVRMWRHDLGFLVLQLQDKEF